MKAICTKYSYVADYVTIGGRAQMLSLNFVVLKILPSFV